MATLYQINNDGFSLERWDIDEESVVVGRSGKAQVSVKDEGLSRRHFLIVRDGESYALKDLSSRNGTWVDGCRVSSARLHHNDRILAGSTLFLFANPPAVPATPRQPWTGPNGTVRISALRSALA